MNNIKVMYHYYQLKSQILRKLVFLYNSLQSRNSPMFVMLVNPSVPYKTDWRTLATAASSLERGIKKSVDSIYE